jgi:hypothetical protein
LTSYTIITEWVSAVASEAERDRFGVGVGASEASVAPQRDGQAPRGGSEVLECGSLLFSCTCLCEAVSAELRDRGELHQSSLVPLKGLWIAT